MKLPQTITNLLQDKKVLVATSAGSDSMTLLDLLFEQKIEVAACYINHLQRPKEIEEEIFCLKTYCQKRNIPFFCLEINEVNPEMKQNKQDFFRNERYRLLEKIAKQEHFDYIATAHHQDDQAETMLMRLVKNYDVLSLNGIQNIVTIGSIPIIRPLLQQNKQEILAYCQNHSLYFCEDSSNTADTYFRNRLRNQVIPFFVEENQQFSTNFIHKIEDFVSLYQQAYFELKNELISQKIFESGRCYVHQDKLFQLLIQHPKIYQKIIIEILYKEFFLLENIRQEQILQLLDQILLKSTYQKLTLDNMYYLKIQYNKIFLEPKQQKHIANEVKKLKYGENLYNDYVVQCSNIMPKDTKGFILTVEQAVFEMGIFIRQAQKDDFLFLKSGTKKLNRLYIDNKVLPTIRYQAPVLVISENEVVFDFLTKKINDHFLQKKLINPKTELVYIEIITKKMNKEQKNEYPKK